MMLKLGYIFAGGLAILALCQDTQGVRVTSGGQTMFFDDFETPSLPALPDSDPDNGLEPGQWAIKESTADRVQVLDGNSAPGSPYVPAEGFRSTNWLKVYRAAGTCAVHADFHETAANPMHAEWMTYVSSTQPANPVPDVVAVFTLTDSSADNGWQGRTWVGAWTDTGTVKYATDAVTWADTGVTWTPDTWQKWEMDYTPDPDGQWPYNGTYTVTVDGQTSAALPQLNTAGTVVYRWVALAAQDGSVFNIDAAVRHDCNTMDFDGDGDVDMEDFAWFSLCFTGALLP